MLTYGAGLVLVSSKMTRFESQRVSLGLALVLVGLPLAWLLRSYLGFTQSSAVSFLFMTASVGLLIRPQVLLTGKLYGNPVAILLPAIFLVPMLALALLENMEGDLGFLYVSFVLVVAIATATTKLEMLHSSPHWVAGIAATAAIASIYQFVSGGLGAVETDIGEGARLYVGDSGNPNWLSFVAGQGLLAVCIVWANQLKFSRFRELMFVLLIILFLVVIVLSGTRSSLAGLLLCLLYSAIRTVRQQNGNLRQELEPTGKKKTSRTFSSMVLEAEVPYLYPPRPFLC